MIKINIEKARAIAARQAQKIEDQAARAAHLAAIAEAADPADLAALVQQINATAPRVQV